MPTTWDVRFKNNVIIVQWCNFFLIYLSIGCIVSKSDDLSITCPDYHKLGFVLFFYIKGYSEHSRHPCIEDGDHVKSILLSM